MPNRWSCLVAGILWIGVGTGCNSPAQPGSAEGSLRVACEWPRDTGGKAVAIVPVLVVREGQIVARSLLVRDNPAVTLSGMTAGRVTVLAAGLAGDSTPLVADDVDAVIQANDTARVVLDLRPEQATPERLTIFGPLMGELRRIAADIAARDERFLAGGTASASAAVAVPSVTPSAPPATLVFPSPVPVAGTTGVTSAVRQPPPAATVAAGGGGGTPAPQPTPTPTVTATPSPSPTPKATASPPWSVLPGLPGGTPSAAASAPAVPWTVPPVPSASVPPIPR